MISLLLLLFLLLFLLLLLLLLPVVVSSCSLTCFAFLKTFFFLVGKEAGPTEEEKMDLNEKKETELER